MADLEHPHPTTLHPGVDPQSWLGFEQRIQARRFEALLGSARDAIAEGNAELAEHSIEEARELRPHAPELATLDAELRKLRPDRYGVTLWRRAGSGVMLLAAGVFMVVALDQTRFVAENLPVIAPAPPLIGAVPTLRDRNALSVFSEEVSPAAVVPEEGDEEIETDPTPAAPAVRPSRVEPAARAAEETLVVEDDALAPAEERAIPLDVDGPAFRPGIVAAPAIAASRPTLAPPTSSVAPPTAVPAVHVDRSAEDQSRVADVLRAYARAYDTLDVSAALAVWPNVDSRALARAFESLESQTVSFDDCEIDVRGATANASCRGQASYVGKVGRGAPRTEPRTWRFELRRDGETWKIANAEARRTSG